MNASIDSVRLSDTPTCPPGNLLTFRFKVWTVILFIILSFALGSVPFLIAKYKTPAGQEFLGQVNNYPDYNAYFSFIHQAYEGKWLFDNHLTYQPSRPILFNFEWLVLGKMMRWFHLSENMIVQVWRFFGAVFLVGGFAFLADNFRLSPRRWILTLAFFSLGGGFGFLVSLLVAAHIVPASLLHSLAIDMWGNLHPFQVIMGNPHAAVATGVELLGFGLFLASERKQSIWYGCWAGIVFSASGFMRPYDLVSFGLILLIFTAVETALNGFSLRNTVRRLLPGVLVLPALAYNVWVFKFDPVFKYWGIQNTNASYLPHFYLYYLAFGVAGWLALNRVLQFKHQPLLVEDRFLLVWFVPLFVLLYLGTLVPALSGSPSIGYTLLVPLLLLGMTVKRFNVLAPNFGVKIGAPAAMALAVCLIAFANIGTIAYYSLKFFSGKTFQPDHRLEVYADRRELAAWRWIDGHLPKQGLIMAARADCNLMGKYAGVRVVAGNQFLTPNYFQVVARLGDFFASPTLGTNKLNALSDFKPDYIYFGPDERKAGGDLETNFASGLIYHNELVSIYRVDLAKH